MLSIRRVVGQSMAPSLKDGQIIVVAKPVFGLKQQDIVVVVHNGMPKVKRLQQVGSKKVFVVGDNRTESTDSRHFGWLDRSQVTAKVIWPRSEPRISWDD